MPNYEGTKVEVERPFAPVLGWGATSHTHQISGERILDGASKRSATAFWDWPELAKAVPRYAPKLTSEAFIVRPHAKTQRRKEEGPSWRLGVSFSSSGRTRSQSNVPGCEPNA